MQAPPRSPCATMTAWLSGQELHRLLTGGWNVSGPPAPRVVIAPSPATPAIAVGEGDPLWAEEFREGYGAAGGGAALGCRTVRCPRPGRASCKQLSGGTRGPAAIFAVPDAKPVILAGDAWRFFLKQSRDASPADYPALASLPVADQTSSERRIIRLSGGGWGPGELIQDQPGETATCAHGRRGGRAGLRGASRSTDRSLLASTECPISQACGDVALSAVSPASTDWQAWFSARAPGCAYRHWRQTAGCAVRGCTHNWR